MPNWITVSNSSYTSCRILLFISDLQLIVLIRKSLNMELVLEFTLAILMCRLFSMFVSFGWLKGRFLSMLCLVLDVTIVCLLQCRATNESFTIWVAFVELIQNCVRTIFPFLSHHRIGGTLSTAKNYYLKKLINIKNHLPY